MGYLFVFIIIGDVSYHPIHICIIGLPKSYICTVENAQPSTLYSTDVLHQLTEGISFQNENIEETNDLARQEFDRKKEKDDEKKDIMSKLQSYFLNMLLNASSTDRDRAAKDITAACPSFFNQ